MPQSSLPFLLAIALALVLTPISRRIAVRIGAIDNPGERRIHAVATPRLGGPAILLAIVLALFFAALLNRSAGMALRSHWHQLLALAIGALAVTLAGAIDDVHPLAPSRKLVVEIAAAAVAVYGGCRIDMLSAYHVGLLSFPLSVVFIVAAVNAVNLVDGLDGLAVGLGVIMSATVFLICLSRGQIEATLMMAALCGALLGFLPSNFHPARIFLGDSGALLVGFMIGVGAIFASHKMGGMTAIMGPLLALGLPLVELTLTTIRRVLRVVQVARVGEDARRYRFILIRRPALFAADRDHIHHRLLSSGLSHRSAVLLLYAVTAASCAAAFAIATREGLAMAPLLAVIGIAAAAGMRRLGYRELRALRSGLLLPLFESPAFGRTVFHVVADVVFISSSCALAVIIDGEIIGTPRASFFAWLPLMAIVQLTAFATSGLYRRSWRNAGIDDALAVTKAIAFAAVAGAIAAMLIPSLRVGARTIILEAYLLATLVLGARLSFRILDHLFQGEGADFGQLTRVEMVDFESNPADRIPDGATETAKPRRSATVVPIRSASVPQ